MKYLSYIIIFVLILFDQLLKLYFSNAYAVGQFDIIMSNILVFGYIQNTGASFGMLQGQEGLFAIITLIALILFGYLFAKSDLKTKKVYTIGTIFLIAGTLGNAIDRMMYGYVIDFIRMPFLPFVGHTFFNLADVLLNAGVLLFIIDLLFLEGKRKKKDEALESNN